MKDTYLEYLIHLCAFVFYIASITMVSSTIAGFVSPDLRCAHLITTAASPFVLVGLLGILWCKDFRTALLDWFEFPAI